MANPPSAPAGADPTPSQEPTTRRVNSGPPKDAVIGAPGGPPSSPEREEEIFAELKSLIGKLWDGEDDIERARQALTARRLIE